MPAPGGGLCESKPLPPVEASRVTFLFAKTRGPTAHLAGLRITLRLLPSLRGLVALNETFLEYGSKSDVALAGYKLVHRRDRRDGSHAGGVALFARTDFWDYVSHVGDSDADERTWFLVHSLHGPILLCV